MSEKEEGLITEGMVRKATYLIHKLADRRGQDFEEIKKRCKKKFEYTNLAKITYSEGRDIIDELIKLTGGEEAAEEQPAAPQLPTKPDDGTINRDDLEPTEDLHEITELEKELGKLAETLQICVGFSRDIVQEEIGKDNITEGTQAMLVKSFAATLFIEASKRGLGK